MSGFAGFVNYTADFLHDMPRVTGLLWKMAETLGGGLRYGIDVLENNGAFVQNSVVPLRGADYYRRRGENAYYLFCGDIRRPLCGAFFLPGEKKLYLFRVRDGKPLYYEHLEGFGLIFGTTPRAIETVKKYGPYKALTPGHIVVYDTRGLKTLPVNAELRQLLNSYLN
ncbi:MAG: hypothetical protein FWE91_05230 [Defluviitaleaceae bacterium]|nr:hypothetical protein [Defluviitaleaceae bacterium]MCL2836836.1 hypothetical protein [Defluviitaleaceae bacterium]